MPFGYDLRLMNYICSIAEVGSISRAAGRLNVSQPSLTRQLRDLENRLDTPLFERTGQGVRVTSAGKTFVCRSREILRSVDALDQEVRAVAAGYAGTLRLGFVGSAINGPLGPGIMRLRTELPHAELVLREAFDDRELMSLVRDGDLDIAVHRLPIRDPSLTSSPWASEPLSVFFREDLPLAAPETPLPLSNLEGLDLILWPRGSAPQAYDEVMGLYQRAGAVPRTVATAHTVQTILALVACGVGVAIMADSYRKLRRAGVRSRPLEGCRTTHFITTADRPHPRLVQNALAVLQDTRRARNA